MFIWNKNDLNQEQEDAIYEKESVLLVACPGSGKTRTLTYKIAYELSQLCSKKQFIIAITYTNTAADEIKDRVELLGVDINKLWIGTIHSFCLEWILRPYSLYLDELKYGFTVINSHDKEEIITELCLKYSHINPKVTYWDCDYIATADGYSISPTDERKRAIIESVIDEYLGILRKNNQIDFEQILFYSNKVLEAKPLINSILSRIFPFILIDEYQDTKEIQYQIIGAILRAGEGKTKTLIVGDPNQSIFEGLGGFPMPKDDLESLIGFSLTEHSLSSNYRSSELIVDYFEYYKTLETDIVATGINKEYESIITFNNEVCRTELVDEIARLIQYNVDVEKIHPTEICITGPQWMPLANLTRSLMVKLPDYSFNGPGMAPFARDIENFWYKLSRIILTEPSPHLYVRRLRWSKEILHDLENNGANVSSINSKQFLRICNSIVIDESDGIPYLRKFFNKLFDRLKIDMSTFRLLDEHHTAFFESSEKRIQKLEKESNGDAGSIDNFKKVFKQRDGITISTMHGVKGEEYDTVIGFGLLDSWVPHFSDENGDVNSKKMLYVLSSRARKNLHLISEKGRIGYRNYKKVILPPTPHLCEYAYDYADI